MSWEDRVAEHPVRSSAIGLVWMWVLSLFAMILIGVLAIVLWSFGVFTSDVKGQGDAQKIKNAGPNRVMAQELFETRYQDIRASDQTIVITSQALLASPNDTQLKTQLLGQKQYCVGIVAKYNADARKFSKEDFRSADLPAQIDSSDPATDCKE